LQNGYYLPTKSDDNKVRFLHRVSTSTSSKTREKQNLGSSTPLFRGVSTETQTAGAGAPSLDDFSAFSLDDMDTTPTVLMNKKKEQPFVIEEEQVELLNGAAVAAVLANVKPLGGPRSLSNGSSMKPPRSNSQSITNDAANTNTLERVRAAIHMDAMAFGMGCCCLQVTFQARDVDESRFLYDQLAVLAPIFMALTASTPIVKGRLADTDARWGIISESVDDRTPAERGLVDAKKDPSAIQPELAGKGVRRVYKSRYDSISTYIYQGSANEDSSMGGGLGGLKLRNATMENRVLNMYNDLIVPIEENMYHELRAAGIDPALSQHVAHLFIRDPLVIFSGAVEELDDDEETDHFESIQSTNWQTVRWKPPPPRNTPNDPHIGWRTEFRSMEMQLTDFENAAFTVLVVLVTRVILTFDLNLYIPLSRVDANMQRAHSRNACAKGKFFFRRHMAPLEEGDDGYGVQYKSMFAGNSIAQNGGGSVNGGSGSLNQSNSTIESTPSVGFDGTSLDNSGEFSSPAKASSGGVSRRRKQSPFATGSSDEANAYEEMTMEEIMCGKGDYYPGLIPLVFAYLDHIQCDKFTFERVSQYLYLIERRAKGELLTPATWMRNFVRSHPSYKNDSVVSDDIAYDLMVACKDIGEGTRLEPTLLGDLTFEQITQEGAYDVKLDSQRIPTDTLLLNLLDRYSRREAFNDKVGVGGGRTDAGNESGDGI
jgi:glutamate--cysteine ligase catalytic subunit